MKITQIMLAKGFGGAERYFVDLSIALAALGHEVQVICHNRFAQYARLQASTGLKIRKVSVAGWWDVFALKRIHRAIAHHAPDVVQAHLARGAYMAGRACSRLGVPLVVKTHNYVDLKYYRNVDCFIATTTDQKNYLVQQKIDQRKIEVIPNFSSLHPVDRIKPGNTDRTVFVSYGRMVEKKGFQVLIEAMKLLAESGENVELNLGGDGPERRFLEKRVKEYRLEDKVRFYGWIDDVKTFVDRADIFVLPSLDEPFGITVLEMMAMGKPIIATRTSGPLEILNNDIAWLVQTGDKNDLAGALADAIKNREAGMMKAKKALLVFREKYSADVVIPKILAVYESLVKR